jgi:hypothetical protein
MAVPAEHWLAPAARATADAALDYLGHGWSVIPVEPRGKKPLLAWTEFQNRRPRPEEVLAWFDRHPRANLAIVTGALSGVVVVDIDPGHGGDAALELLVREHGPLPATPTARSGGGGLHFYFAHPGVPTPNRAGLRPGIDVRGDGGCVVAPPSLHASGERYRWLDSRAPRDVAPAPLPDWLLLLATGRSRGRKLAEWRQLVQARIPEGRRNSTLASLAGHLLWHGVDAEVLLTLLHAWNRSHCVPPLPDAEVAQVVRSIATLHERGDSGAPSRAAGGPASSRTTSSSST